MNGQLLRQQELCECPGPFPCAHHLSCSFCACEKHPACLLLLCTQAGGVFGSGLGSQGGSASSALESKWVQRVRDLYRTIPAMHDATVGGLQDVLQVGGWQAVAGHVSWWVKRVGMGRS